ncbi:MAG: hypothetical protein V4677_14835 [Bacteroidota bacterium]
MKIIRFIFFLSLLTVFLQVKASAKGQFKYLVSDQVIKTSDGKYTKVLQLIPGNERFSRTKKIKQRGMGGVSPCISNISFGQVFTYCKYLFIPVENTYASFLYCVDCKRGPPTRS